MTKADAPEGKLRRIASYPEMVRTGLRYQSVASTHVTDGAREPKASWRSPAFRGDTTENTSRPASRASPTRGARLSTYCPSDEYTNASWWSDSQCVVSLIADAPSGGFARRGPSDPNGIRLWLRARTCLAEPAVSRS